MNMRRKVIRASESIAEEKGLRVINVSLDVVVPDHANDNQKKHIPLKYSSTYHRNLSLFHQVVYQTLSQYDYPKYTLV